MTEERKHGAWAEHFTREDLIEAARRAFPLRHTDNGAGLRQLIRAIRQTKERCEARALAAQLKRTQESMQEIEGFRAGGEPQSRQD